MFSEGYRSGWIQLDEGVVALFEHASLGRGPLRECRKGDVPQYVGQFGVDLDRRKDLAIVLAIRGWGERGGV